MKPGDKIGRFEIQRRLGHGAVGAVFLARDSLLDTAVCLKLIHAQLAAEPEVLARFSREVLLSRRVTHPNVCRIFDLHEEDGTRFVTMEFIQGETLAAQLTSSGAFGVGRSVRIAQLISEALGVAHDLEIIHRDLKPGNIIMRGHEDPVVLDFGIATAVDLGRLTRPGIPLGTTHYIAPEVWLGEKATVASDVFSLGIILFNMLTAEMPFHTRNPVELIQAIKDGLPAMPSSLNPRIPRALDELIERTLAFDPAARPMSAGDLGEELALLLKMSPMTGPTGEITGEQPGPNVSDTVILRGANAEVTVVANQQTLATLAEDSSTQINLEYPSLAAGSVEETEEATMPPRPASPASQGFDDASFFVGDAAATRLGDLAEKRNLQAPTQMIRKGSAIASEVAPRSRLGSVVVALLLIVAVAGAVVLYLRQQTEPTQDLDEPVLTSTNPPGDEAPVVEDPVVEDPVVEVPVVEEPVVEEPVVEEPVVEVPVVEDPDPVVTPAAKKRVVTKPKRSKTRRPPPPNDGAYRSAQQTLKARVKARGLLFGDDPELDRLRKAAQAAAKRQAFDSAASTTTQALARTNAISVDREFVNRKLLRFNRRFAKVSDDTQRKTASKLLGDVLGEVGGRRYEAANRALNAAFAAIR